MWSTKTVQFFLPLLLVLLLVMMMLMLVLSVSIVTTLVVFLFLLLVPFLSSAILLVHQSVSFLSMTVRVKVILAHAVATRSCCLCCCCCRRRRRRLCCCFRCRCPPVPVPMGELCFLASFVGRDNSAVMGLVSEREKGRHQKEKEAVTWCNDDAAWFFGTPTKTERTDARIRRLFRVCTICLSDHCQIRARAIHVRQTRQRTTRKSRFRFQ